MNVELLLIGFVLGAAIGLPLIALIGNIRWRR